MIQKPILILVAVHSAYLSPRPLDPVHEFSGSILEAHKRVELLPYLQPAKRCQLVGQGEYPLLKIGLRDDRLDDLEEIAPGIGKEGQAQA